MSQSASAPQPGIGGDFREGASVSGPGGRESAWPGPKRTAKAAVFAVLRWSGAALLARHTVQARRVTMLAYHDPDPDTFERHLALLTSLYSVIDLTTFLSARAAGDLRALPVRAVVLTLDDGWAGNVRLLPALQRHGVRPTVFLCTSIVGTNRHYWWTHAPDQIGPEPLKGLAEEERLRRLASFGFTPDA